MLVRTPKKKDRRSDKLEEEKDVATTFQKVSNPRKSKWFDTDS
jgi:hypothetical protein